MVMTIFDALTKPDALAQCCYKLKQFVSRDLEKILSLHFLVERIPFSESNTLLLLSFSFFVRRQMSKGFQ